jgi:hypothetical protein
VHASDHPRPARSSARVGGRRASGGATGDHSRQLGVDPRVVQQLMFNRILSYVKLLWVEGVTVAGFDPKTGTLVGSLAGVHFVVNVNLGEKPASPIA